MVTIFWSVFGFHVVDILPKGVSFDTDYFRDNILAKLVEKKEEYCHDIESRKVYLHCDNCRVHRSFGTTVYCSKNGFDRVPHPTYSPDLAPSDFFLFGYTKDKLQGKDIADEKELEVEIRNIVEMIPKKLLTAVFNEWIERCRAIITNGGSYVD